MATCDLKHWAQKVCKMPMPRKILLCIPGDHAYYAHWRLDFHIHRHVISEAEVYRHKQDKLNPATTVRTRAMGLKEMSHLHHISQDTTMLCTYIIWPKVTVVAKVKLLGKMHGVYCLIAISGVSNQQLSERSRLCLANLESGIVSQEFFCAATSQQPLSASLQKARGRKCTNLWCCQQNIQNSPKK